MKVSLHKGIIVSFVVAHFKPIGRLNEAPGGRDSTDVISLAVLDGLRKLQQPGRPDFVTELIDLFLDDASLRFAELRVAAADSNMSEVKRLAHLMKGSSANIGAGRLAELYEELEAPHTGIPTAPG